MDRTFLESGTVPMLGLRRVATAFALMVFATPLSGQSGTTARDTAALGRLKVSITAVAPANVLALRAPAPEWTAKATTTPPLRRRATWTDGDGSHATAAAMMIVGAGLLAGTVVSGKPGTKIMIGSGLLGLVGLWRYAK